MTEEVYTPDECAKRCRISRAGLYNAWAAGRGPRYFKHGTRRRITETAVLEWLKRLKDGEEITLGEKIPTETYDDLTFQTGNLAHAREKLDARIADKLDPREAQIIADRYLREKPLTLDGVGGSLGVSHQRAGQLEARAIGKLSKEAPLNKPIGKHNQNAMVQFYADAISQHNDVEGYVDAARLRFPDATQADRIAAHRMADKLRLRVDLAPPKHVYSEPKPSPQMAHHRCHAAGLAKSRGNKPLRSWRGPYGGPVIHGWR